MANFFKNHLLLLASLMFLHFASGLYATSLFVSLVQRLWFLVPLIHDLLSWIGSELEDFSRLILSETSLMISTARGRGSTVHSLQRVSRVGTGFALARAYLSIFWTLFVLDFVIPLHALAISGLRGGSSFFLVLAAKIWLVLTKVPILFHSICHLYGFGKTICAGVGTDLDYFVSLAILGFLPVQGGWEEVDSHASDGPKPRSTTSGIEEEYSNLPTNSNSTSSTITISTMSISTSTDSFFPPPSSSSPSFLDESTPSIVPVENMYEEENAQIAPRRQSKQTKKSTRLLPNRALIPVNP